MSGLLLGIKNSGSPSGSISFMDTWQRDFAGGGGTNVDWAIGAFTGTEGLPGSIGSNDWINFANALWTKTSEMYDGDVMAINFDADHFVGVGGGGNDRFFARSVSGSSIRGNDGNDTLTGYAAGDLLLGDEGNDLLDGAASNDSLDGGVGDDTLIGGYGNDTLSGGSGVDWLDLSGAFGAATVNMFAGTSVSGDFDSDIISGIENVLGTGYADAITGDAADNHIIGEAGADTIIGGRGNDTLEGGDDIDTLSYANANAGVTVALRFTTAQNTGGAGIDTISGFETLIGSAKNDDLTGDPGNNLLVGGDGADTLMGLLGDDVLDGGAGIDTVEFRLVGGSVTADLSNVGWQPTGDGIDQLIGIENIGGSRHDDSLTGDNAANALNGRAGDDKLAGGEGADTLTGGAGRDRLLGGAGVDVMSGGADKDRFVFYSVGDSLAGAPDRITDLDDADKIDISSIDANVNKGGDQRFELVAAFTDKAGQAVLKYDGGADRTRLMLDVNGDGQADAVIVLDGDHRDFAGLIL